MPYGRGQEVVIAFEGKNPEPVDVSQTMPTPNSLAAPKGAATESGPRNSPGRRFRLLVVAVIVVMSVAAGLYLLSSQIRAIRLARTVRRSFASRRLDLAREPLERWLALDPRSGEAHYYRAWQALAADQPGEAFHAIEQARAMGFDRPLLDCLSAIGQSRSSRFDEAEPILERAFRDQVEPQDIVAMELARIYLSSYRLDQAARAIERWRGLAPEDPNHTCGATRSSRGPTSSPRSPSRIIGPPSSVTPHWTRRAWVLLSSSARLAASKRPTRST